MLVVLSCLFDDQETDETATQTDVKKMDADDMTSG
jgi:hypothetical protein